ncbi:histidine phosphatase family protein [Streptomyces bauhiniae]|uniref:histidine phosphatase family protein n=1 Tax=Streptomyces bauhiniae TaxID=2340725 RepID=UPI001FCC687D|nr:histidine phosphatase family protein [Streptomyces bauhiniae]
MPLICLVRHGQASAGADDYDVLSEPGQVQAAAVGRELARRGLRDPYLVSGTLRRQRDTAQLIAEAAGFGQPLQQDARWNEYDHLDLIARYAPAPGQTTSIQDLLDHALLAWMRDPAATDADGETWAAFTGRATAGLAELSAALGRGRDAVVVTSGGSRRTVRGVALTAPRGSRRPEPGGRQRFRHHPRGGGVRDHLADLQRTRPFRR